MIVAVPAASTNTPAPTASATWTFAQRDGYAKHYKGVCEKLQRVNGKWFLVVPGELGKGMSMEQMTANLVETS